MFSDQIIKNSDCRGSFPVLYIVRGSFITKFHSRHFVLMSAEARSLDLHHCRARSALINLVFRAALYIPRVPTILLSDVMYLQCIQGVLKYHAILTTQHTGSQQVMGGHLHVLPLDQAPSTQSRYCTHANYQRRRSASCTAWLCCALGTHTRIYSPESLRKLRSLTLLQRRQKNATSA